MQRLGVLLLAVLVLGGTGWAWSDFNDQAVRSRDATQIRPEPRDEEPQDTAEIPRVVFLGDSYVSGDGAKNKTSNGWVPRVSDELGWEPINLGYGGTGYVTAGSLEGGQPFGERLSQVLAEAPDLVVVSGGRNDMGSDPAAVEEAAEAVFRALASETPVIAMGPIYDYRPYPDTLADLDAAVQRAADRVGVPFVTYDNPLIGMPELFADGTHPNSKGYALIADAVAADLSDAASQVFRTSTTAAP